MAPKTRTICVPAKPGIFFYATTLCHRGGRNVSHIFCATNFEVAAQVAF